MVHRARPHDLVFEPRLRDIVPVRVAWIQRAESRPGAVKRGRQDRAVRLDRREKHVVEVGIGPGNIEAAEEFPHRRDIRRHAHSQALGIAQEAVDEISLRVLEARVIDKRVAVDRRGALGSQERDRLVHPSQAVIGDIVVERHNLAADDLVVVAVHRCRKVVPARCGIYSRNVVGAVDECGKQIVRQGVPGNIRSIRSCGIGLRLKKHLRRSGLGIGVEHEA